MPYSQLSAFSFQSSDNTKKESDDSRLTTHDSLGFTLIEILVAVSIITVVFGVVLTSAAALRKSSRDSQRIANLLSIQNALAQYYADQQYYPSNNFIATGSISGGTPTKNYLSNLPKDPTSPTQEYCYLPLRSSIDLTNACDNATGSLNKCQYYHLCSNLEKADPTNPGCNCRGAGTTHNYRISPL